MKSPQWSPRNGKWISVAPRPDQLGNSPNDICIGDNTSANYKGVEVLLVILSILDPDFFQAEIAGFEATAGDTYQDLIVGDVVKVGKANLRSKRC